MPLTEDFTASAITVELLTIVNDPPEPLPEFWLPTETLSVTCEPEQMVVVGVLDNINWQGDCELIFFDDKIKSAMLAIFLFLKAVSYSLTTNQGKLQKYL